MALSGLVDACSFTEPDWIHDTDEPFINRRDRLPEPAECPKKPGVWELIKDFVGMDLAKVSHACSMFIKFCTLRLCVMLAFKGSMYARSGVQCACIKGLILPV